METGWNPLLKNWVGRRIYLCSAFFCIPWWVTALMERTWGWIYFEIFRKQGEGGYTSHFVPHLPFVTVATSKWILIVPLRAGPLCRTPKPQQF